MILFRELNADFEEISIYGISSSVKNVFEMRSGMFLEREKPKCNLQLP
jgi:hypothetical protein